MKKFSFVIPVYNEPYYILKCLNSIYKNSYSKNNYEVLIINDYSTDSTKTNIENFIKKHNLKNHKLINNKKNLGRMETRMIGAKNAKYNNIIFIDSRVTLGKNSLRYLSTRKEKIILGTSKKTRPPRKKIYSLFFYLLRKKLYKKKYFPEIKDIIKIHKKNFNQIPKGTTTCYIKKDIFFKAMGKIKNTDKSVNDDIKLLINTLNFTKYITRLPDFKIKYHPRENTKSIISHTFNRGPRFVDYYFQYRKKFFLPILFILVFTILNIIIIPFYPYLLLYDLILIIIAITISSIYLSENPKDFLPCFKASVILSISFYLGILKGIFLKTIKTIKSAF